MQFFSRKKMLLTAGLAAMGGLAACGDDVTVPVPPLASVVISITPPNASMNIGESLTFAVQITGGSTTTPPTLTSCTSSNAAVASASVNAGACKVTAVAAGNATVTAAASTGQQASAAVSVSAQAAAASGLTLSPTTANLSLTTGSNTVTITPNVTKANSANTVTYTYATSNAAIASIGTPNAAGAVVVTAVAPGTATITATANASGTGYSNATLTAAATVTVANTTPSINSITVQPTSLTLPVGVIAQLTTSVSQPTVAPVPPTATVTYSSSATSVATVSATGLVTAVGPGSANITVTATSAGNTAYAQSTVTQIVPVNVNPIANVTINTVKQGPTVSTGIDSAYSGWDPAAAARTGLGQIGAALVAAGVNGGQAQGVIAGIRVAPNPQIDQSVDITNTKDQIQVDINLQTNGQRVDSVVVYVDPATTGRRAAARQTFAQQPSQGSTITLFVNTADFTIVGGVGEVHFPNGLKAISASVWSTLPAGSLCNGVALPPSNACEIQNASDNRQSFNFNNIDGFALQMTNPANTTLDATSRTWWGGPTTSDIGQPTGALSFQAFPVIYTPNRSIIAVTATFGRCQGFGAGGVPNGVTKTGGPYIFTAGTAAPATPAGATHIGCGGLTGAYDVTDQFRFEDYPQIVASLDNSQNPGPRTIYAYNPTLATDPFGGPRPTLFRQSAQVISPAPIRVDYLAPTLTYAVPGTNGERWVNDTWAFNLGYTATDFNSNGTGVGLFVARNTLFRYASANPCAGPTTFQDIPGGLAATVLGMGSIAPNTIREHPCDFTNNAYVGQATETDRLGNRATVGSFSPAPGAPLYGVDNTIPELMVAYDAGGPIPDMPNIYQATADSIFQPLWNSPVNGVVPATPIAKVLANGTPLNLSDFNFGVRYRDERSGFNITNHGTRRVTRWRPNATPLFSNVAVLDTVSTRTMNFVGGFGNPQESEDPTFRRDSTYIYGFGPISGTSSGTASTNAPTPGYYRYNIVITDRAGNSNTLQERAVIDRTSPNVTGVLIPAVIGASGTATAVAQTYTPTGDDDTEAWDADLYFRYPAMELEGDGSIGSINLTNGSRIRFRHDRFVNFHNVWQVFTDGLLSTPFGPGAALSNAGLTTPIPSIRGIEPVDATNAPIAWGQVGVVNPFAGFKPNEVGAYAFDVRATHRSADWIAPYNLDPAFTGLGMNNASPMPGAPPLATPFTGEAARTAPLFAGIVSNGTRWDTKDLNSNTPGLDRLVGWFGFGGTGTTIEFRATTSTIVTQPPFAGGVHLFKWEADVQHTGSGENTNTGTLLADSATGQWVYIGTLNTASLVDQGATRTWRYIFTAAAFPAVTNGRIIQPGIVAGGCYRAVGTDISGDGITTRSFGTCPAPGVVQGTTVTTVAGTPTTVTLRAYGNAGGTIVVTSTIPGGQPAFSLTKTAVNGVERISQNRNAVQHTITFTPNAGATIEFAPLGCTLVGTPVFPSAVAVSCILDLNVPPGTVGPTTITAVFEQ